MAPPQGWRIAHCSVVEDCEAAVDDHSTDRENVPHAGGVRYERAAVLGLPPHVNMPAASSSSQAKSSAIYKRPRGAAPKGKSWDEKAGQWVPVEAGSSGSSGTAKQPARKRGGARNKPAFAFEALECAGDTYTIFSKMAL